MGGPVRDITGHVVCALSQLNDGVAVSFAVLRVEDMEPQKRISRILNMEYFWRATNDASAHLCSFFISVCRRIVGELLLSILYTLLHPLPAAIMTHCWSRRSGACFAPCECESSAVA